MKVLGFTRSAIRGAIQPVSYYRVGLPLAALNSLTQHEAESYDQYNLTDMMKLATERGVPVDKYLDGRDIYVFGRLFGDRGAEGALGTIRSWGAKIVFDTDDDLTGEHRELDGKGSEFIHMVEWADLVTVSTPYLGKKLEPYAKRQPVVLPNHIDFNWFSRVSLNHKRETPGLTVGVIGTRTHYHDWEFLKDVFLELERKYSVTILTAGYQPDYLKGRKFYGFVPYERYPTLMAEYDIVCCALDSDDKFNWSKSSIKALESMASARRLSNGKVGGAVAVCTDMPVYRRTVNHMHNGLLIDNGDWLAALQELIENENLRNQLAYRGHRWVKQNRDISLGYTGWKRAYQNLLRS